MLNSALHKANYSIVKRNRHLNDYNKEPADGKVCSRKKGLCAFLISLILIFFVDSLKCGNIVQCVISYDDVLRS